MKCLPLIVVASVLVWQAAMAATDCVSRCPVYVKAPPPVCGCKQYYDECHAKCDGATHITPGPCPCICTKIYKPVCGDGVTYGNECMANCAGAKVITEGPCCPRPCAVRCADIYDPVCADGVTYKNKCLTACLCPQPKSIQPGECPPRKGR